MVHCGGCWHGAAGSSRGGSESALRCFIGVNGWMDSGADIVNSYFATLMRFLFRMMGIGERLHLCRHKCKPRCANPGVQTGCDAMHAGESA